MFRIASQISHLMFVLEKERKTRKGGGDGRATPTADSDEEDAALFGNIRQLLVERKRERRREGRDREE